jgi:hypothetical protein
VSIKVEIQGVLCPQLAVVDGHSAVFEIRGIWVLFGVATAVINQERLLQRRWIYKHDVALVINMDVVPIDIGIQVDFGKLGKNLCLLFGREAVQFLLEPGREGWLLCNGDRVTTPNVMAVSATTQPCT